MTYPLKVTDRQLRRSLSARLAGLAVFTITALFASHPSAAQRTGSSPNVAVPVFVTLGTGGGPVIRRERSEPANVLVVGDVAYLFDVGDGVQRQLALAHISPMEVRAVFISHHHIDHDADLGPFIVNRWLLPRPSAPSVLLRVIGPPGTAAQVAGIAAAHRATELSPIQVGGPAQPSILSTTAAADMAPDMDVPTLVYQDDLIRVLAITNDHYHFPPGSAEQRFSRSYSFRIESAGQSIVYTGDTGPSPNVERLAKDADMLVSEVIDIHGIVREMQAAAVSATRLPSLIAHMQQDHLTPTAVGVLAARAHVRRVVLTHIVPGSDGETDMTAYTDGIADHYRGPVAVARDLDRFTP